MKIKSTAESVEAKRSQNNPAERSCPLKATLRRLNWKDNSIYWYEKATINNITVCWERSCLACKCENEKMISVCVLVWSLTWSCFTRNCRSVLTSSLFLGSFIYGEHCVTLTNKLINKLVLSHKCSGITTNPVSIKHIKHSDL